MKRALFGLLLLAVCGCHQDDDIQEPLALDRSLSGGDNFVEGRSQALLAEGLTYGREAAIVRLLRNESAAKLAFAYYTTQHVISQDAGDHTALLDGYNESVPITNETMDLATQALGGNSWRWLYIWIYTNLGGDWDDEFIESYGPEMYRELGSDYYEDSIVWAIANDIYVEVDLYLLREHNAGRSSKPTAITPYNFREFYDRLLDITTSPSNIRTTYNKHLDELEVRRSDVSVQKNTKGVQSNNLPGYVFGPAPSVSIESDPCKSECVRRYEQRLFLKERELGDTYFKGFIGVAATAAAVGFKYGSAGGSAVAPGPGTLTGGVMGAAGGVLMSGIIVGAQYVTAVYYARQSFCMEIRFNCSCHKCPYTS